MSLQYVKLYDVNEGLKVRGTYGGPYLDVKVRWEAEEQRAINEGRAADHDPLIHGPETRLVTAKDLVENHTILENPNLVWEVSVNDLVDRDIIAIVPAALLPVQLEVPADDDLEV